MRIVSFWSVNLLLVLSSLALGEATVKIEGRLVERGTRKPIPNANVYALPAKIKTTTDEKGVFAIEGIPEGEFTWIVNVTGYDKLEKKDEQKAGVEAARRTLYLEKPVYDVYETTVYGKEDKRDDRTRSLKPQEFLKLPGSNGDPVKAVQNLPGVARPIGFSSQVVIEGSAPIDTKYTIDGHEVPIIFHFGGLTSVVFPQAIDRVDYLASGYGAEYSRALGGLVGVWTKPPVTSGLKGVAFVDTFQAGALFEFGVPGGGGLVAARRSYVGEVLKAIAKGNKNFDLTVAPSYTDGIVLYETSFGPNDKLRLLGVGSHDILKFVLDTPVGRDASGRGSFSNTTSFYRFIPQYTLKHGERATSRWSIGIGRDLLRVDILDDFFDLKTTSLSVRGELEYKITPDWLAHWGVDNRYTQAEYSYKLPGSFGGGGGGGGIGSSTAAPVKSEATPKLNELGLYWRNQIKIADTPWTLLPSARFDYFNTTREGVLAPRLAVRYQLTDSLMLRSAGGLYAQPPQGQQIDETLGNPSLRAPRAWHATAGLEKDFRGGTTQGFVLTSDAFYKAFTSLVIPSTKLVSRDGALQPERYTNDGTGQAFGIASQLRFEEGPYRGWIAYTLSRSTRFQPDRGSFTFQYDQTHLLNAVASVELPEHWTISARARYTTGNAYTPILSGIFDSDTDLFRAVQGPFFSERLDAFFSLDIRVDKKWVFDDWMLSAYLDVQNVTNRKNSESIRYSYDYARSESVTLLPIIPTFGLKGEF